MPAYLVVDTKIHDHAGYEEYKALARPIVEQHGGTYLVRGGGMEGCLWRVVGGDAGSCFLLGALLGAGWGVGAGFGLFAVFSVMRYRTETMPIREMSYFFVLAALPVINALLAQDRKIVESLTTGGVIIAALFLFEKGWGFGSEESRTIVYNRLKLLKPEHEEELLADLKDLTGLPISRFSVNKINYARKSANVTVYFRESEIETRQG